MGNGKASNYDCNWFTLRNMVAAHSSNPSVPHNFVKSCFNHGQNRISCRMTVHCHVPLAKDILVKRYEFRPNHKQPIAHCISILTTLYFSLLFVDIALKTSANRQESTVIWNWNITDIPSRRILKWQMWVFIDRISCISAKFRQFWVAFVFRWCKKHRTWFARRKFVW